MHMVCSYQLLHSLIHHAAEGPLNGHVYYGRLDVVSCHPLQALRDK